MEEGVGPGLNPRPGWEPGERLPDWFEVKGRLCEQKARTNVL